ncbi:MAG: Lrp/AsnC family transcriptional regulator [Nanoarchaeota archaeon]|nr:Lrp/AsnC family transcriptional regulator [Nanoarchaeota archaeon]
MDKKLDKKDIDILWQLHLDSKQTHTKIAKKLKIPKETVKYRIEQLVKKKIIKKFYAINDSSKLGLTTYQIFLKIQGLPASKQKKFVEEMKKIPNISWFVKTSGKFSFLLAFLVKNPQEFYESYSIIRELFKKTIKEYYINMPIERTQFDYPFFKNHGCSRISFKNYNKSMEVDELSLNILNILSENCRVPIKEIAEKLNSNEKTIKSKISFLEKSHLIIKYGVHMLPGKVGYFFYLMLIRFNIPNLEIEKYIQNLPEIFHITRGIGVFDLQLEFYCSTEGRIYEIEEELYEKYGNFISNIDIMHISKEYLVKYFVKNK